MSEEEAHKPVEDFARVRWYRRINRQAQVVLAILLALALNLIAAGYYLRADLHADDRYSLSVETSRLLSMLEAPVKVISTLPPQSTEPAVRKIYQDVSRLLEEYRYEARRDGRSLLELEFVDLYRDHARAAAIASEYELEKENQILVTSGELRREISLTDLYEVEDGEPRYFKGESVFTSAILEVSTGKRSRAYFTTGHGELDPNSTSPKKGLSDFVGFLESRNVEVVELDLSHGEPPPEDADLLIVVAPRVTFLEEEVEALDQYLRNNGRLLVYLDPRQPTGLAPLFEDWGILTEDIVVLDTGPDYQSDKGDLIISQFDSHPITKVLLNDSIKLLVGLSQVVRPIPTGSGDERLLVQSLIRSSSTPDKNGLTTSWGERDWKGGGRLKFDRLRDLPGPVSLAAVAERLDGKDLGIALPGGRLVVLGNADLVTNRYFSALGNRILANNVINWMLRRDHLLDVKPRTERKYQLTLTRTELIRLGVAFLLPAVITGLLGFIIGWIRRLG